MPAINFFTEEADFELTNKQSTSDWVIAAISSENFSYNSLNVIFCSDDYLHQINVDHLDHDYYTDIITFDNSEVENEVEGDLFISIDRVRDNASEHNVTFNEELHRVIIHGTLHLLGYNDKSDEDKIVMREKENAYLSLQRF